MDVRNGRHEDAGAVEALWVGEDAQAAFVVLHRAEARAAQATAVLIVPPFGWADVCSHRDRQMWADVFAAAGFASARIWLPGAGDSGGSPRDADLFARWRGAVTDAGDWLRESTRAERVVAFGIGLGGLTTLAALHDGARLDDLILWDVAARGSTALRRERAYAGVLMSMLTDGEHSVALPDGSLQLAGYRLDGPLAAEIGAFEFDPAQIASPPHRRVLLLDRDGLPVDRRLENGFRAAGAEVTVAAAPDWLEFTSPADMKSSEAPPSIETTVAWVRDGAAADSRGEEAIGAVSTPRAPPRARAQVVLPGGISERALTFDGPLAEHFAVATDPPPGAALTPVTALWLHHIGPSRMWIELARRWAARGIPVVRADLPGMHEAGGEAPRSAPISWLYRDETIRQTRDLVEGLAAQGFGPRFILGGYCAGAYWAMHAALADSRIVSVMLVNLAVVRWDDDLFAEREAVTAVDELGRRAWQRVRTGKVSLEVARRGVRRLARHRRAAARPAERAQVATLAAVVERLHANGTHAHMSFTRDEPLLDEMRRADGLDWRNAFPNLAVEELPTADHPLWTFSMQGLVHATLDRGLDCALERIAAGVAAPSAAV